ncbi:MAG TPA: hypothetical protein VKY59_07235 [Spirillospora sp.]|nr:hypothetical protein [Spirillospora sp.]
MTQGIQIDFDNAERTVIRWDFKGRWTWDDWYAGLDRALELRAAVNDVPVVPAILDFRHSGQVPMGALAHTRAAIEIMDPRDYAILANGSGYIRSLVQAFCLLNPSVSDKVLLADSLAEARDIVMRRSAK